jgi:hypothetical protein
VPARVFFQRFQLVRRRSGGTRTPNPRFWSAHAVVTGSFAYSCRVFPSSLNCRAKEPHRTRRGYSSRKFNARGFAEVGSKLGSSTAVAALCLSSPAAADIRITGDSGGDLRVYRARVDAARLTGERVVIDGLCASACTLWLTLPANQICATPRGRFLFHWATDARLGLPDRAATERLTDEYPPHVRRFIVGRGGLWLEPIIVSARTLASACRRQSLHDAQKGLQVFLDDCRAAAFRPNLGVTPEHCRDPLMPELHFANT